VRYTSEFGTQRRGDTGQGGHEIPTYHIRWFRTKNRKRGRKKKRAMSARSGYLHEEIGVKEELT